MKNLMYLLLMGLLFTACATEQEDDLKKPSPADINEENPAEITFDEKLWDFGEIAEGEIVEHDYTFTNTGKSDLIITDAKSTCGCTVPEKPKEPIPPGGSGKIKVRFNSRMKAGPQSKTIRISANTHPKTVTEIKLKGVVLGPKKD